MLFNSYVFIFAFLPLSFLGYFLLARWRGGESAMTFLVLASRFISGPIIHYKEMLPQFMRMENHMPQLENVVIGLAIFSLGLFKKVVIADGVAPSPLKYSPPPPKVWVSDPAIRIYPTLNGLEQSFVAPLFNAQNSSST